MLFSFTGQKNNRIFRGVLHHFDHKIAFRYAQDNLGVKKVSALPKKSLKRPDICFAQDQKNCITRIRGTLVFVCPCNNNYVIIINNY
jgi:hypothetical protein